MKCGCKNASVRAFENILSVKSSQNLWKNDILIKRFCVIYSRGELVMKKTIIILLSLLMIMGLVLGGCKLMTQFENNEIEEIVKSEEAEQIYLKQLTSIDPDAFTEKGKIQKYTIDSFKKIPTGGIFVYLYVNDNKAYTVSINLYKDYNTGKIKDGAGSWSSELDKFVKGKKDE
jgi:hypothetical secreted protein